MQNLPGGPDELHHIQRLSEGICEAEKRAEELEVQTTLRPEPSQYHELTQEIDALISRSCNLEQANAMLANLMVSLDVWEPLKTCSI